MMEGDGNVSQYNLYNFGDTGAYYYSNYTAQCLYPPLLGHTHPNAATEVSQNVTRFVFYIVPTLFDINIYYYTYCIQHVLNLPNLKQHFIVGAFPRLA